VTLPSELLKQFRQNIQTYTIILALVAIWLLFAAMTGGAYLNPQNFSNLFRQMTVTAFLAVGMVLVIVTVSVPTSRFWPRSFPSSSASGSARCLASFRATSSRTSASPRLSSRWAACSSRAVPS
jgi:hypothetical protein